MYQRAESLCVRWRHFVLLANFNTTGRIFENICLYIHCNLLNVIVYCTLLYALPSAVVTVVL